MAKGQADLIAAVLSELGRRPAGTEVSDQDRDAITPRLAPIVADLERRRVATIALAAIPDHFFPDLVRVVAEHVAPMYQRQASAETLGAAEARLREIARLDRDLDPFVLKVLEQLTVYRGGAAAFDAVAVAGRIPGILRELSARNVVDNVYEVGDLPEEALPDLARYVAASLCAPPLYEVMTMAEARLRSLRQSLRRFGPVCAVYF